MTRPALSTLTSMRFFAALAVFVTHVTVNQVIADDALADGLDRYLGRVGYAGVTFFFVLSGFVLMWSTRDRDTVRAFYRRRLVKIFPNHAVTWTAGLVLMAATGALAGISLTLMLPSLVLLQSWSPSLTVLAGTNGPSWSLACELLFYLAFPLLAPLVRRVPPQRLWAAALAATVLILLPPPIALLLPASAPSPFQDMPWTQNWFAYFLPAARLGDFVLGLVMARIVAERRLPSIPPGAAVALVALGYAGMLFLPGPFGLVAPIAPPLAVFIAVMAVRELRGHRGWLASPRLVWLGEISFAFYMVHFLVLQYGPVGLATQPPEDVPRPLAQAIGLIGISFVLSLALGWALYRSVEVPAMKRWSGAGPGRARSTTAARGRTSTSPPLEGSATHGK